jgi:hypothetical protein
MDYVTKRGRRSKADQVLQRLRRLVEHKHDV